MAPGRQTDNGVFLTGETVSNKPPEKRPQFDPVKYLEVLDNLEKLASEAGGAISAGFVMFDDEEDLAGYNLPFDVDTFFAREMEPLRYAHEHGEPVALYEALALCVAWKRPLPDWLAPSILEYTEKAVRRGRGRGNRPWGIRLKNLQINRRRFWAVAEARKNKLTWEESYKRVQEELAATDPVVTTEAIKQSYIRHLRRLRSNPPLKPLYLKSTGD